MKEPNGMSTPEVCTIRSAFSKRVLIIRYRGKNPLICEGSPLTLWGRAYVSFSIFNLPDVRNLKIGLYNVTILI
jgi:hypothetical protein